MADQSLQGKRIAILAANDFEQVELVEPRKALDDEGAETVLISPQDDLKWGPFTIVHGATGEVKALKHDQPGDKFKVDMPLEQANADDFDALMLPGGAMNPDQLRVITRARDFVKKFDRDNKPIAAICHAPWTLVSSNLVSGRTLTSWPTLQDDIRNAGGHWVDNEVVVDRNWVTSRGPHDIPAFNREMVRLFAEWDQTRQREFAAAA